MPRVAIVFGGAACLHEDRAAALDLFTPDIAVWTNGAGRLEPGPVSNWATMHPELFPLWIRERQAAGLPAAERLWCPIGRPVPPTVTCDTVASRGGSSGLLAVFVALEALGADKVVVCGCPLDQSPHFDDPKAKAWRDGPRYRAAWEAQKDKLRARVRSMSGWTRRRLGAPTAEWLAC